jgi:hypothetical protein
MSATISTTAYLGKQVAMTGLAALAGAGIVMPMAWLPAEPLSAAFLGVIGGCLQLSVPWIVNADAKPTWLQGLLVVFTSALIAVFGNGIQIPLLNHFVADDSLWRVNTLMLAFIGISVPMYIKDMFPKKETTP